jgi:hypothetical protein
MGEARHDPVGTGPGLRQQRALQRLQPGNRRIRLVPHPEPEIGRHLVVAAARGVKPPGRFADDLLQARLHVHVDVLQRRGKREIAASISDKTVRSPSRIASASLSLRMPVAASMAAWAREPSMSWRASRLSNPIEALIASMIASGPAANRPPHIVLDPSWSCRLAFRREIHVFRMLLASVLYLALSAGANAQDMSDLLTGEMRGLVVHDAPQAASDLPFLRVDGTEGSLAITRAATSS